MGRGTKPINARLQACSNTSRVNSDIERTHSYHRMGFAPLYPSYELCLRLVFRG